MASINNKKSPVLDFQNMLLNDSKISQILWETRFSNTQWVTNLTSKNAAMSWSEHIKAHYSSIYPHVVRSKKSLGYRMVVDLSSPMNLEAFQIVKDMRGQVNSMTSQEKMQKASDLLSELLQEDWSADQMHTESLLKQRCPWIDNCKKFEINKSEEDENNYTVIIKDSIFYSDDCKPIKKEITENDLNYILSVLLSAGKQKSEPSEEKQQSVKTNLPNDKPEGSKTNKTSAFQKMLLAPNTFFDPPQWEPYEGDNSTWHTQGTSLDMASLWSSEIKRDYGLSTEIFQTDPKPQCLLVIELSSPMSQEELQTIKDERQIAIDKQLDTMTSQEKMQEAPNLLTNLCQSSWGPDEIGIGNLLQQRCSWISPHKKFEIRESEKNKNYYTVTIEESTPRLDDPIPTEEEISKSDLNYILSVLLSVEKQKSEPSKEKQQSVKTNPTNDEAENSDPPVTQLSNLSLTGELEQKTPS